MRYPNSFALSLLAYLADASPRTMLAQAKDPGRPSVRVNWTKPSSGDVYGPGSTIIGGWTSSKAVVSPSLSLCSQNTHTDDGDQSDCGQAVWPEVKHDGHAYHFPLVPDITSTAKFYLRMKDDFGHIVESPAFSLDPSVTGKKTPEKSGGSNSSTSTSKGNGSSTDSGSHGKVSGNSDPSTNSGSSHVSHNDSSGGDSSQPNSDSAAPSNLKKPHSSLGANSPTASGDSRAAAEPADSASQPAQGTRNPTVSRPSSGSPSASSYPSNGVNVNSITPQEAALSRAALPTAAIAVPLSLLGATLLASLGLYIVHRRSLAAQRARNAHLIDVQRNASMRTTRSKAASFASSASTSSLIKDPDIEKAIDALCGRDNGTTSRHASLRREGSVIYVPIAAGYPVPRQDVRRERTRPYDRSFEWPYDRRYRFSRTNSDRYTCPPSPRSRYYRHSPTREFVRPPSKHHRRNSSIWKRQYYQAQDEDDGASSTDTILSGYITPRIPASGVSRYESYHARPREPPRSHSRQTAPEMEGYHCRRVDDIV